MHTLGHTKCNFFNFSVGQRMFPDRILSLCLSLARDGTAAEELWGWEKTAPFDGEVGQLEECRLIGNTEVNGKYAITSVFF